MSINTTQKPQQPATPDTTNSAVIKAWQIERMRDRIDVLEGAVSIRIYNNDRSSYKIWYNPRDDVSLYGRITFDPQEHKDHLTKAWLQEVLEAINAEGAKVFIQCIDASKSKWFAKEDAEMSPLTELYEYAVSLTVEPESDDVDDSKNSDAEED